MRIIICLIGLLSSLNMGGQFAPPAGVIGTTAISKDSSAIIAWATHCNIQRGWMNAADTTLGQASVGDTLSALGKANNLVVSLGDGGTATLEFDEYIIDGPGWDFAVFENAFTDDFLELAFVEVSSDGINFFRFPAASLTQDTTQVGSFGLTDATKINNLAGKYRAAYGTPFNLSELQGIVGLDIQKISHVKIIDVIGTLNETLASRDTADHKINDPWPTAFASSGFDLDAVGVINSKSKIGLNENKIALGVFPNPCSERIHINLESHTEVISIYNLNGKLLQVNKPNTQTSVYTIELNGFQPGQYLIRAQSKNNVSQAAITIVK